MLSYRAVGNGPAILLLHGLGVTRSIWRDLEPELSKCARLIMVELPGFGRSSPPNQHYLSACVEALVELRQVLGIARWTVLSYSASADIGKAYIRRDAAYVSGGIFLCPILRIGHWPVVQVLARGVLWWWPTFTNWLFADVRLRWMIVTLAFNSEQHPSAHEWFQEIRSQPIAMLQTHMLECFDPNQRELPPDIPIIRIWGRHDRLSPRPRPLRQYDRIIDANHSAPVLAAPLVLQEVCAFLQRVAAPVPASIQTPGLFDAPDDFEP